MLVLEKAWAEYLTVGVTTAFLPWEVYEIIRRLDWLRVGLLVTNLMVLAYLVWWLRRNRAAGQAKQLPGADEHRDGRDNKERPGDRLADPAHTVPCLRSF